MPAARSLRLVIALSALCLVGACTGSTGSSPAASPASSPASSAPPGSGGSSAVPSISFEPGGSPASPAPAPSAGVAWTQVVGGRDVLMMDVVAFPGGVVAVGGARPENRGPSPNPSTGGTAGPGDCLSHNDPAACAGPVAWRLAPDGTKQGVGPLGGGGALHDVAWAGTQLVAIGCLGQAETWPNDCANPTVWTSTDGLAWSRATVPARPSGATGIILSDIAAMGDSIIVAGCSTQPDNDVAGQFCAEPAAWRSTDGARSWTQVGPLEDEKASGAVQALAADGAQFVAAGFVTRAEPGDGARVWTSTDGVAWSPAGLAPADSDGVDHVIAGEGIWLAIGSGGRLWHSTDGSTWQLQPGWPGDLRLGSIAAVADGFVAIGQVKGNPVVWTSPDAVTWDAAAADFLLQDPETAVAGDRIVAIGREGIWLSDPIRPGFAIR